MASPVVDVGSGGGFPGIPIALAFPGLALTLFEPRKKRAVFLHSAVDFLKLASVTVEQTTAQTAGRGAWRGRARTVITRAVGKPLVAIELGLPLLAMGGSLVMYVGRQALPSAEECQKAVDLGGSLTEARVVDVPYLTAKRHVWVFEKSAETPEDYPRRSGVPPRKEPMFPVEQSALAFDRVLLEALPNATVFAVGGRVRDEILTEMGRPQARPDLDYLVTGISLEDLLAKLRPAGRAELVGAAFGVVKFTVDGVTLDVALPRRERSTGPHHRDFVIEAAEFIPIEDDLARRDFRMNMMARDLRTGAVIDPYGGRADLEQHRLDVLREEAFVEDPLRVLRGAQFAARFGLQPTDAATSGMRKASDLIPTVSAERIADELTKLLQRAPRPSVGFELLREVSALHHILPELLEGWAIEQNEYHRFTVYYHSLACCDEAPNDVVVRLAALLHDVGKPRTKDGPHFYRHEFVGEEMARAALERLRFPNDVIDRVCHMIALHMYNSDDALTDAAIRRFIKRVTPARIDDLFALRHADVVASGHPARDPGQQNRFEERVRRQLAASPPFGVQDLAIDGDGVKAIMRDLGLVGSDFAGDQRVGAALKHCLELVLDDPQKNDPSILRAAVRSFFAPAA